MPDHKPMTTTTTPTTPTTPTTSTHAPITPITPSPYTTVSPITRDTVVGYYNLTQDTVFHYAGYECAAWSTDTLVKAGRYPVYALIRGGSVDSFAVSLPGTIVTDYFPALFCGNLIGKPYNTKANAGKPSTHHITVYAYDAVKNPAVWDLDLAILPYVGKCLDCGCAVFGYPRCTPLMCPSCGVMRDTTIKAKARFPRVIATVSCTWEFSHIADIYVAKAVYERDPWARVRVASAIRRVRKVRRLWPATKTAGWLRVGDVDKWGRCSVEADGRHLGYLHDSSDGPHMA